MITVKVCFENGDSLLTGINMDISGARRYYVGRRFNIGQGGQDNLVEAISCDQVDDTIDIDGNEIKP